MMGAVPPVTPEMEMLEEVPASSALSSPWKDVNAELDALELSEFSAASATVAASPAVVVMS